MLKSLFTFFFILCFSIFVFSNGDSLTISIDSIVKLNNTTDTLVSRIELEKLTNLILKNDKEYYSFEQINQFINLKKEDLAPLDDETIKQKLKEIETTLNIRFTKDIANKIRYYIYYNRNFIVEMLTKSEYYFPMFEKEFDKLNIPLELKYVSIIESHLKPKAKSPMGATGLWQFMYATAKYKGMKITTLVDERKDPNVSTEFAAKYFKQLHGIYDDWLLAISAYNAGAGNINKAIRYSGGYKNYWIARPFMPRETQQYVPKIIAIMYVMYYAEDYMLFSRKPLYDYYNVVQVDIPERLTIKYVSELIGVDSLELSDLNPMLTKNFIPNRTDSFKINIPSYAKYNFEENFHLFTDDPYLKKEHKELEEKLVNSTSARYSGTGKYQTYIVTTGDNLGYIAELFSCRVSDIKRWNGLRNNFLKIGQKIRIYNSTKISTKETVVEKVNTSNIKVGFKENELDKNLCNCKIHKIIYGDNLWDIANKYSSSIEKISFANNIYKNWRMKIGTYLKIPLN